jgi:hypothetical protein
MNYCRSRNTHWARILLFWYQKGTLQHLFSLIVLKGHSHRFNRIFLILYNAKLIYMYFWSYNKIIIPCDQWKERCKAQILYHVNKCRVTYTAMHFQCGLDTLSILPFKATFVIYKFILNTNKQCLVFVTSNFVLNMIFMFPKRSLENILFLLCFLLLLLRSSVDNGRPYNDCIVYYYHYCPQFLWPRFLGICWIDFDNFR